ncbi:hypothetical protein L3X38_026968 [Prunus dulcis]|uniref:Uncharacterized protein n=1 Tax=Prunus dulcis TaxID=3755 RepID=A0AAD4VPK9_PRUDU|nr:hypothetical protein L3X38_026968 [Prunus dulcis]
MAESDVHHHDGPNIRPDPTTQGRPGVVADYDSVLEQVRPFPLLPPRKMFAAPWHTSNKTLAPVQLGSTQLLPHHLHIQADLSLIVNQLTQRVDDQNNLVGQLLKHIDLVRDLGLRSQGEERMMDEHTGMQFERS